MNALTADGVKAEANALGFDAVGVADAASPWPEGARLREFLDEGRHGSMAWMEDTAARRAHPTAMWAQAKSAVMLGMNYGPDRDPLEALAHANRAAISVYAKGADYHDVVKKRLKRLARWMVDASGGAADVKVFVDTAPLMEKPLSQRAGVGWQGKHTNLVSREHGSWLFLGSVLTTAALTPDPPERDHCGSCRACLDVCPTDAFPAPYQLDARRCLSYLTIENKGPIPRAFRAALGNRIYGCDDCLSVCPWNKFAEIAADAAFHARAELAAPRLEDLAALDDAAFRSVFAASPIKRIGRDRFVRNVAVALGNAGPSGLPAARRLLDDASALVRGAAVWACARLMTPAAFAALAHERKRRETDPQVLAEWEAEATARADAPGLTSD